MTPVLGIIASSNQQGRGGGPVGSYDALATITVPTGGLASITFAGIPAGYKDLQIRALATSSGSDNGLYMTFNSDSSATYKNHWSFGNGTTTAANSDPSGTSLRTNMYVSTNLYSSYFSSTTIDILDYANLNKNKVIRSLAGNDRNGAGFIWILGGVWFNTNPVTSISFTSETNLAANSSFALYGVK